MPAVLKEADGALLYTSFMSVDADGAHRAYHLDRKSGLDYLANAGGPGNWYGVVVDDKGNPVVQGPHDPAPGFLVSPTSYADKTKKATDPLRYVNSSEICYIAVAKDILTNMGVHMGDLAMVSYKGKLVPAIVADAGPKGKYGEGSIALAKALGIPSSPKNGGAGSGVKYCILKNTASTWPRPTYQADAKAAFDAWGGEARMNKILGP